MKILHFKKPIFIVTTMVIEGPLRGSDKNALLNATDKHILVSGGLIGLFKK
ncbi:hypothetical protein [Flavobacterium sp. ZB4P13]|uniref:hypothetical protein n=1 Tax=Flavobacterium sp. ZB4P13 TaxID=3401728 RepID=UPI003AACDBF7